tara:strand:- start:173 stop:307 length:135 start_codon:yes stop_codon:yes gene_type:complete
MTKKNAAKNGAKDFGKMVKDFGSNWKKIKDTAAKKKQMMKELGY